MTWKNVAAALILFVCGSALTGLVAWVYWGPVFKFGVKIFAAGDPATPMLRLGVGALLAFCGGLWLPALLLFLTIVCTARALWVD